MWNFNILLIILLDGISVLGQIIYGCPNGWETYSNRCYKFEMNEKRFYEEADAECWMHGAQLLSVSNFDEHQFIVSWLKKHDSSYPTNTWFTSGVYRSGAVTWDENDGFLQTGDQLIGYWHVRPSSESRFTRIAYVFKGGYSYNTFAWDLVSASIPSAYICELDKKDYEGDVLASRDFDYGQGLVDPYDIERGPYLIVEPKSVVVFNNVPSVYIECAAYGNPHPSFYWHKLVDDKAENITSKTDSRYTLSGGRFTIQGADKYKDSDLFQCVSSNKFGTVLSQPAEFIFGNLAEFSPVKPADVVANKFEGNRISCQAPAAYPEATYSWYTDTIKDYIFSDMYPHRFISQSGYLYFSSVQPTDERFYKCVVTLSAPTIYDQASQQPPSRTSLGIQMVVTGTEHGLFEPIIYTYTFPQKAIRGTKIRLECIAYGSLPLVYTWSREDGKPFAKGTQLEDQNRVLTIENVQLDAEGNYICDVNGKGGFKSKTIILSLEAKPYFPFGIGNKFVDPGQTLKWRCKAVARPKAIYAWYKNGQLLENGVDGIEVQENVLTLRNIDKDRDEGMYQCSATNVHGTTYSSGQLKVLSFKPTFDRQPLPTLTVAPLGGNITIPCAVEAAPIPVVEWLKNGGSLGLTLGDTGGRIAMTIKHDLVLREITTGDQGSYTCKASNSNGEAMNTTYVQVIRGISITTAPTSTRVRVNTTAFLYCQAAYDSLNYDLTYNWLFNGHKIDLLHNSLHYIQSTKGGLNGLYIINAQFQHEGLYTCEAKTPFHTDQRSAVLSVIGPPGPSAGVYVEPVSITPYSARIIWTVGLETDHGNPIHSYDIEAEVHYYPGEWKVIATDVGELETVTAAVEFGLRSDQRTHVVDSLFPNLGYRFRVRAINEFGRGQEASKSSVTIKTPSTAPVSAPVYVGGGGGKVGTLTIEWKALDQAETCGPGFGYNVFLKKKDDPKDWFKAIVKGREKEMYTHLVGEEFYYLEYEVKVGTFNVHGDGPNSSVEVIYSAEGMPVARPVMGDCSNYNGSAIHMQWTPVPDDREHMKGRVKGYKIQYRLLDEEPDSDYIWNRDVYGQQEEAIIIGLRDNTNYWVRVQVFNTAGLGPIGEWRLAETFHLPPLDYPRHVKVFSHGEHSVRITWQGIITKSWEEESLQGYIVRIWKTQEDIRTAEDFKTDKRTEVVINNLQRQVVYVMRVLGYSIGGEGSKSPHVYFTVGGGSIPFDPSTTKYCFDDRACDDGASSNQISYFFVMILMTLSLVFL